MTQLQYGEIVGSIVGKHYDLFSILLLHYKYNIKLRPREVGNLEFYSLLLMVAAVKYKMNESIQILTRFKGEWQFAIITIK